MIYRRCLAKHMFWVFENMTAAGEPKELTHSRALALSLSVLYMSLSYSYMHNSEYIMMAAYIYRGVHAQAL